MANFDRSGMTQAGINLMGKAVGGATIQFTRLVLGDGTMTGEILDLQGVVSPKQNVDVTRIERNDNQCTVGGELLTSSVKQGFFWRECGLYAMDPDVGEILYNYAYSTKPDYIAGSDSGMMEEILVSMIATVGSNTNVDVTISDSMVFATKKVVDKKPYYYNTVADMKADTSLKKGDMAITLGYYASDDGGAGEYMIVDATSIAANGTNILLLANGLIAKLIVKTTVTPIMFGAKGDGVTDDTNALLSCIGSNRNINFIGKTYNTKPLSFSNLVNFSISNGVLRNIIGVETIKLEDELATINFSSCAKFNINNVSVNSNGDWYERPFLDEDGFDTYDDKRKRTYGGFRFMSCSDFLIESCIAEKSRTGYYTGHCENAMFHKCLAQYTEADGYYNTGSAKNITLKSCRCYYVNDDAFTFLGYYSDSYPDNNYIIDCSAYSAHALVCLEGSKNSYVYNTQGEELCYTPIKLGEFNTSSGQNSYLVNVVAKTGRYLNNKTTAYNPYLVNSKHIDSSLENNKNYYLKNVILDFSKTETPMNIIVLFKYCSNIEVENCTFIANKTVNFGFTHIVDLIANNNTFKCKKITDNNDSTLTLTYPKNHIFVGNKFNLFGDGTYIIELANIKDIKLQNNVYLNDSIRKINFWMITEEKNTSTIIDNDYFALTNPDGNVVRPKLKKDGVIDLRKTFDAYTTWISTGQLYIDSENTLKTK